MEQQSSLVSKYTDMEGILLLCSWCFVAGCCTVSQQLIIHLIFLGFFPMFLNIYCQNSQCLESYWVVFVKYKVLILKLGKSRAHSVKLTLQQVEYVF